MKKSIFIFLASFTFLFSTSNLYSSNSSNLNNKKIYVTGGGDTLLSTFDKIKLGIEQVRLMFDKNKTSKGWNILRFIVDIVGLFVDDKKHIINKNGERIYLHSPQKNQYQTSKASAYPDRNY